MTPSNVSQQPRVINLHLRPLHPAQLKIKAEARRFNVLNCGRRFGKDVLGIDRLIEPALRGFPVAWFSPTYSGTAGLTEVWAELKKILEPVITHTSEEDQSLELMTGGTVKMWSLEKPDGARGRAYKRVIVNEAAIARYLQEAWEGAIRPTLSDYEGDAWFMSTPKGYNYFRELYVRGLDPSQTDWTCWQLPTRANPYIRLEEIESARRDLSSSLFAQEYEASFEANAEARFNLERVNAGLESCRPEMTNVALPLAGVDWASQFVRVWSLPRPGVPYVAYTESAEGKGRDYTVTYLAEGRTLRIVATLRENVLEPGQHAGVAERLARWYNTAFWGVERNRGEAVLYVLGQTGYPRVYWHRDAPANSRNSAVGTTSPLRLGYPVTEHTRGVILEDLATVIDEGALGCDDPTFWRESQTFVYNERGRPEAAPGAHDDTVMCMAGLIQMAKEPEALRLGARGLGREMDPTPLGYGGGPPSLQGRGPSLEKRYTVR